jgi:hypothetical protein
MAWVSLRRALETGWNVVRQGDAAKGSESDSKHAATLVLGGNALGQQHGRDDPAEDKEFDRLDVVVWTHLAAGSGSTERAPKAGTGAVHCVQGELPQLL